MEIDPATYLGPEYELWKQGDPFIVELVQADDLIIDHRYNYDWFGESAEEGNAIASGIERWQLSFELETLYRWWSR